MLNYADLQFYRRGRGDFVQARQMVLKLSYDNKDISTDIEKYVKSVEFNDSVSNEADDISITLEDRKELWENDWFPEKGATLKASFVAVNWGGAGNVELPLGTFEVDQIEISGLPHEVKIKAVSVPNNNNLRDVKKNKSWEKIKLSALAKEIADNAGMKLYLNLREDDEIDRVEQNEESDLEVLIRVAKEKNYGIRISDSQLDVYYIPDLDNAEPVATIKNLYGNVSSYSFKSKTRDTYKSAHVRYENTKQGNFIEYTFDDPDKKEGKVLEIHKKVENVAEAEKLAKAELRDKNKDEITGDISFAGMMKVSDSDTSQRNLWLAGFTVKLEGFHVFDGKYLVTNSSHSLSRNGYQCSIQIRKCLNGY